MQKLDEDQDGFAAFFAATEFMPAINSIRERLTRGQEILFDEELDYIVRSDFEWTAML